MVAGSDAARGYAGRVLTQTTAWSNVGGASGNRNVADAFDADSILHAPLWQMAAGLPPAR